MQKVFPYYGLAGPTQRLASTDVAQLLPAGMRSYGGRALMAVDITCETNAVRIAYGTPTQDPDGLGHKLNAGDKITLCGTTFMANLRYISCANSTAGALQVTPYYGVAG